MAKYIYVVTQLDGTRYGEGSDLEAVQFVKENKHLGAGLAVVHQRRVGTDQDWVRVYNA